MCSTDTVCELQCSVIEESGSQQQQQQYSSISMLQGTDSSSSRSSHLPPARPPSSTPPSPPLGMIISPLLRRTIIFQVRSYPSPLSFFMPCFCPGAALHICTVPVQYVKEVNICSVQSVISIYLFSLLVNYCFFPVLEERRPALAMYLNQHDCCVCTRLQGVLLTGETKLYI